MSINVWNLFKNNKISKTKYRFLHSSKSVILKFYGLLEIHKVSVPLRPIVSFIKSFTYNFLQFLSGILSG